MIGILSTHADLITQVRRACERSNRELVLLQSPHHFTDVGSVHLLVLDLATAVEHGDAYEHIAAFQHRAPSTRIVCIAGMGEGISNREVALMLRVQHLPGRVDVLMRDVATPAKWDELVAQVAERLVTMQTEVKMVFMPALLKASKGPLDQKLAHVLVALLDAAPTATSVKDLAVKEAPSGSEPHSINALRLRQNRAWRKVFGENRLPTKLCVLFFRLLWYRVLTEKFDYSEADACYALRAECHDFHRQMKRRIHLSRNALHRLTCDDLAAWIAALTLAEFTTRPSVADLWQYAPSQVKAAIAEPRIQRVTA